MPERWRRLEQLYHAALERAPNQRAAFLRDACPEDDTLRREVESLLVQESGADRLLEAPALEAAARMFGKPQDASLIGSQLGHYQVISLLGVGGMGEVYRAHDIQLGRDVAIKVLPEAFSQNPDRLARFRREAKILAALNHPHIAAIYGLEDSDSVRFLVLELVEGPTLMDRLRSGAIAVNEALPIARQIADAIEYAHEHNVIHRDLKPANVKMTPEGTVKVLDFGLAKGFEAESGVVNASNAPTVSAWPTMPGAIVGTPAYMSPEQARGNLVDKRTDIWAFGAVLYELLTGRCAFSGPTLADTLTAVLEREPDWSALPETIPLSLRRLLKRCLAKNPRARLRDIGDARLEIEEVLAGASSATEAPSRVVAPFRRLWAAGTILLTVLAGWAGWFMARQPTTSAPAGVVRLTIPFLESPRRLPIGVTHLAVSDDGLRIAYAGNRLWLRQIDQDEPIALAESAADPFFSPDGEWIGFFDENTGLRKVPAGGGPSQLLVMTTERPAGGAWRQDGTIVFATTQGLFQLSEAGGEVRQLTAPDRVQRERLYAWPQFLPGGESLLFSVFSEDAPPQIVQLNLKTLARKNIAGGSAAQYVAPNRLVFVSGGALKTVAFDAGTGQLNGDPVTIAGVDVASAADNGAADYAISASGTLVFMPAREAVDEATGQQRNLLQWIDQRGNKEPVSIKAGNFLYPRISPDGTRVALDVRGENRDIWILDLARLSLTQLTNGPTEDMMPEWSPDGTRVFFASDRTGNFDIYSQASDGASAPRLELAAPGFQTTDGFTRDGTQMIVYNLFQDLATFTLGHSDRIEPLLTSNADERLATVSPDGRWLLYESDESGGKFEIFVRPFPNVATGREKISVDGGRFPRWDPNDGRIYYVSPNGAMMAASITLSPAFKVGTATKLFDWRRPPTNRGGWPYDIARIDGRFLVTEPVDAGQRGPTQVSVVLNWVEELKRRVPAGAK